ncbi:hypothetical protein IP85_03660 [Rhizobium sp. AAP116]|nr:hypothetical protein IP85_03660 [Rhizobium sp. AAP116]
MYPGGRLSAGLFASPAGLRTDAAMVMHLGMAAAFLAAGGAGTGAGLDETLQHLGIPPRAPYRRAPGGKADISAVLVQPDTLAQLVHHVFGKAGIGTGNAGLRAVEAGLNAGDQRVIGAPFYLRMGFDHGANGHGSCLLYAIAT